MMKAKFDLDRFRAANEGAVAPLVAVALFGLIGAAGVAFDYSRLVTLDTELQNAADQAALAAASQLNGKTNATRYAQEAATNLVANATRMANDGATPLITVASVVFYADKAKTTVVTRDDASSTDDASAHFVEVTVGSRSAFYALTPVIGAMSSGPINAKALAGLGSAVCKVPPVMMCNPNETGDPSFTTANYIGRGIRLIANGGGGAYAPGNFGFLDVGAGNGASSLRDELGKMNIPGDCVPITGVTTEPGSMVSVLDALNTRFDVYANGLTQTCGANGAGCPPSANTRKDIVNPYTSSNGNGGGGNGNGNGNGNGGGGNGGGGNSTPTCSYSTGNGAQGWQLPASADRYLPSSATTPLSGTQITALSPMGYPRDMCHAVSTSGSCSGGRIGDALWDREAYFRSNSANYPTITSTATMNSFLTATFGTTTPTRYQVYNYEMNNAATRLQPQAFHGLTARGTAICVPPGITPSAATVDRRRISAAVVNCTAQGVAGHTTNVAVQKWVELFLVEPSLSRDRTSQGDVYVEVIGETGSAGSATAGQVVRRDAPYLIE